MTKFTALRAKTFLIDEHTYDDYENNNIVNKKAKGDALNTLKFDNKITIEKYTFDPNDTPFISKQKEIFNKLVDEKLEKITDLDEKVNNDDLIYRYKGKFADTKFDEFDNALGIINKIRDSKEDWLV